MTLPLTQTDKLAQSLLAKQGVGAIWKLHEAAAAAQRGGFPQSAVALIEVAEAAERLWSKDGKCRLRDDLPDLIAGQTA
jgi:hypothetical protein